MCDVSTWNALCARCGEVYEKYGSSPIPTTLSDNPHQVFLDIHVDLYIVVEITTLCIRMVRVHPWKSSCSR